MQMQGAQKNIRCYRLGTRLRRQRTSGRRQMIVSERARARVRTRCDVEAGRRVTSNETSTPAVALPASFVLPNISKRAFRWGRYLDRRSGWSSIDKSSNAHRIIVQMLAEMRSIRRIWVHCGPLRKLYRHRGPQHLDRTEKLLLNHQSKPFQ